MSGIKITRLGPSGHDTRRTGSFAGRGAVGAGPFILNNGGLLKARSRALFPSLPANLLLTTLAPAGVASQKPFFLYEQKLIPRRRIQAKSIEAINLLVSTLAPVVIPPQAIVASRGGDDRPRVEIWETRKRAKAYDETKDIQDILFIIRNLRM